MTVREFIKLLKAFNDSAVIKVSSVEERKDKKDK